MGLFDKKTSLEAMEDLLDRERAAILDGRFDLLERLIAQKDRQTKALNPNEIDKPDLDRLRHQSEKNARLLDAMRDGIKAAQKRITELQGPGPALETYEADGRRNSFQSNTTSETRRV